MSIALPASTTRGAASRRVVVLVAIWVVLILVPFWLPLLGGYTRMRPASAV